MQNKRLRILLACCRPLIAKHEYWMAGLSEEAEKHREKAQEILEKMNLVGNVAPLGEVLSFVLSLPHPKQKTIKERLKKEIPLLDLKLVRKGVHRFNVHRINEELNAVLGGLNDLNRSVEVVLHPAATPQDVDKLLESNPPFDVLHLICHGSEDGSLNFEDGRGSARQVTPKEFAELVNGRIRLIVNGACHSELALAHICTDEQPPNAAVGIDGRHPIPTRAIHLFAQSFYPALVQGKTIQEAFDRGVKKVRMDEIHGETVQPDEDGVPTPWKRFMLKSDGANCLDSVPHGKVELAIALEPSPHVKIMRTDEPFIGRKQEMAAAIESLEPPRSGIGETKGRIVTLHGEGGIGKTRLAQAIADWEAERGRFPGGVFEIACELAKDTPQLAVTIMKGLGISEAEKIPKPETALPDILKKLLEKRGSVLLVLDNLDDIFARTYDNPEEHPGVLLKKCLTQNPDIRFLNTCRTKLNLGTDEQAFELDPMVPDEAAELFLASIPDRDIFYEIMNLPNDVRLSVLGEIVKAATGHPQALVLTAHRLIRRGETIETLLENLSKNMLEMMEDPKLQHLPERLRSVRASFELSYQTLSEDAKKLFARMSFFPDGIPQFFIEELDSLLGKDWQRCADEVCDRAMCRFHREVKRYYMLRPMREYAKEKLNATEGDAFRIEAAKFWHDFAGSFSNFINPSNFSIEVVEKLSLPNDLKKKEKFLQQMRKKVLTAFEWEENNLVETAAWAMYKGLDEGVRISDFLLDYFNLRSRWFTWEQICLQAIGFSCKKNDENAKGQWFNNLGETYRFQGRWPEAIQNFEQSLLIFRELKDRHRESHTLNNLSIVYLNQGLWLEAIQCSELSLQICRELKNRPGEGQTLGNLGNVYLMQGRWLEAIQCYEKSLLIFRELKDRHREGQTLGNLGIVYSEQGRWPEAIQCHEQSLLILRELKDRYGESHTLTNLGIVYREQSRWPEAIQYYEQSLQISHELKDRYGESQTLANLGVVYSVQGKWPKAIPCLEQSLSISRELGDRPGESITLTNLGIVYHRQGRWPEAIQCYQKALLLSIGIDAKPVLDVMSIIIRAAKELKQKRKKKILAEIAVSMLTAIDEKRSDINENLKPVAELCHNIFTLLYIAAVKPSQAELKKARQKAKAIDEETKGAFNLQEFFKPSTRKKSKSRTSSTLKTSKSQP